MLDIGRDRQHRRRGSPATVRCVLANAECLPFADDSFHCVTIGFGLRNVTDKPAALASMLRVLKPGGQLLVLEFSKPVAPGLKPLYDGYSFKVLPLLGRLVANDSASYQLSGRVHSHASRSGNAARPDARPPALDRRGITISERRHRRRASRLQGLT